MGELTCSIFFRYIKSKKQMVFTKIVKNTENKRKGLYILSLILLFSIISELRILALNCKLCHKFWIMAIVRGIKKLIPGITAWDRFT